MTTTLVSTLRNSQYRDVTAEAVLIRNALSRAIEDTEADGGTPTPVSSSNPSPAPASSEELENTLQDLIVNEKWSNAISFVKHHRGHLHREMESEINDDISLILNIYCKKMVQDRPECFIITNQENDLADVFGRLFQVSTAVSDLESVMKEQDQLDTSLATQAKD